MKMSLEMACADERCSLRLKVTAIVEDRSDWNTDIIVAELGWRRSPGTKDVYCPDHISGAT